MVSAAGNQQGDRQRDFAHHQDIARALANAAGCGRTSLRFERFVDIQPGRVEERRKTEYQPRRQSDREGEPEDGQIQLDGSRRRQLERNHGDQPGQEPVCAQQSGQTAG